MAYGFSVFWLPLSQTVGISAPVPCGPEVGFFQELFVTDCDWKISTLGWMYTLFFVLLGSSAAIWGGWPSACRWLGGYTARCSARGRSSPAECLLRGVGRQRVDGHVQARFAAHPVEQDGHALGTVLRVHDGIQVTERAFENAHALTG